MTAKDLYADVLRELDRYQSPSFERHEFNYFLPKAMDKVLLEAFRQYRESGQSSEVLDFYSRTVSKDLNPNSSDRTMSVAQEPNDRYILSVLANWVLTKDVCPVKKGRIAEFYLEEIEAYRIKDIMRNSYLIPNLIEQRAYWINEDRSLKILYGSPVKNNIEWQLKKVEYITVKEPDTTNFLLPSGFQSMTLPQINVPNKILRQFINATVTLFLENTMNPRVSTHTTINT